MVTAAGLIILILLFIGVGVGIYYGYTCYRVLPKTRSILPEHDPLIVIDGNGNHEGPSAPGQDEDPLSSKGPQQEKPSPSGERDNARNENVNVQDPPNSENSHKTSEDPVTSSSSTTGNLSADALSSTPLKAESILPIEEEPSSPGPATSCLDVKNSVEHENHEVKIHINKFLSDTDEEDGLLQNRPQMDDSLDKTSKLEKNNCTNVERNSPYGWKDEAEITCSYVNEVSITGVSKSQDKLNTTASDVKIIKPATITVIPSTVTKEDEETVVTNEENLPLSEDTVNETFYHPVINTPPSLAYHLSSAEDNISIDSNKEMTEIKEDLENNSLVDPGLILKEPDSKDLSKSSDEQDSNDVNNPQNTKDQLDFIAKENTFEGDNSEIRKNLEEELNIAVTDVESPVEHNKVESPIGNVSTSSDNVESADSQSDSETSEPELTEYHFNNDGVSLSTRSAIANEVCGAAEIQVTSFSPLNVNKSNKETNKALNDVNQDFSIIANPNARILNDTIAENNYNLIKSEKESNKSSSNAELDRAISEEIIDYKNSDASLENDLSIENEGAKELLTPSEETTSEKGPTDYIVTTPDSPSYEPMPSFYVVESHNLAKNTDTYDTPKSKIPKIKKDQKNL